MPDPEATAQNIAASPELWRLGIAVDVVMQLCDVPVMLILFLLLSPVNKNVALLALLFNLVQTATLVANQLTLVAAQLLSTRCRTDVARMRVGGMNVGRPQLPEIRVCCRYLVAGPVK